MACSRTCCSRRGGRAPDDAAICGYNRGIAGGHGSGWKVIWTSEAQMAGGREARVGSCGPARLRPDEHVGPEELDGPHSPN